MGLRAKEHNMNTATVEASVVNHPASSCQAGMPSVHFQSCWLVLLPT